MSAFLRSAARALRSLRRGDGLERPFSARRGLVSPPGGLESPARITAALAERPNGGGTAYRSP
jgi:hypothetical protein